MNETCPLLGLLQRSDLRPDLLNQLVLGIIALCSLRRVCKVLNRWATESLRAMPGLTMIGGTTSNNWSRTLSSDVHQLNFASMTVHKLADKVPEARAAAASCILPTGRVVVLGGYTQTGRTWNPVKTLRHDSILIKQKSSEWLTKSIGSAQHLKDLDNFRVCALPNGSIMVAGGSRRNHQAVNTVMSFDPVANSWTKLPEMNTARESFAIGRLNDGRVIVAGGGTSSSAEVYSLTTKTWSELPNLKKRSYDAIDTGTVSADGRFFAIGSCRWCNGQVYDPATNQWTTLVWRGDFPSDHSCITAVGSDVIAVGRAPNGRATVSVLSSADRWVRLPATVDTFLRGGRMTGVFAEELDAAAAAAAPLADVDITAVVGYDAFEKIKQTLAGFVSAHLEINEAATGSKSAVMFKRTAMMMQPTTVGSDSLTLLPHQLLGLNWLWLLVQNGLSGVLNDEMGLGKTIQSISVIGQMHSSGDTRPSLVVVPPSVLENWEREVKAWLPGATVVRYHGSEQERSKMRDSIHKPQGTEKLVLISSYSPFEKHTDEARDLKKIGWGCCVIDEAQILKSDDSLRVRHLLEIQCVSFLLLTGVDPTELSLPTLAHFLMPLSGKDFAARIRQVAKISLEEALAPLFLRRLQSAVVSKEVPKFYKSESVQLEAKQRKLYDSVISANADSRADETVGFKERERVFQQLWKAANHPMLLRSRENVYTAEVITQIVDFATKENVYGAQARREQVFDEVDAMTDIELHVLCSDPEFDELTQFAIPRRTICGESAKLRRLRQLLPALQKDGHRMILFSQWSDMLDILEEMCLELQMDCCRLDGRTPVSDRQQLVDEFNANDTIPICLMTTRAAVGINLVGADTVIFHDVNVLPQQDRQAESRCYRLGQTRTVTIYKLSVEDTVDAAVADVADRSDTSLQIHRSGVQLESDMQIDSGGGASGGTSTTAAAAAAAAAEKVPWKDVVLQSLTGLGLFGEE
jgi:SWI/SNF-related matrix-associated actin-dependent regulator 1 of chromatin subfamily A